MTCNLPFTMTLNTPDWAQKAYQYLWQDGRSPIRRKKEDHSVRYVARVLAAGGDENNKFKPTAILVREEYDLIWAHIRKNWDRKGGLVIWSHPGIGERPFAFAKWH
jgi:hypothetical protein